MYTYGGTTDYADYGLSPYYGGLHRLDIRAGVWTTLFAHQRRVCAERGPSPKVACSMLCYEDRLLLYGGRRTCGNSIGLQASAS